MTTSIDTPTQVIAAAHARWKRNRDMIAGEDAVKKAGEVYLPRLGNQTDADYLKYLARVPFFPGAARTHAGMLGLVTRKTGVFERPDSLAAIFDTITHSGHTVDDLAEEVMGETLTTNFTGLLIDFPTGTASTTARTVAEVEALNVRPFISSYIAESILEISTGVIANSQKIVRVRLLEDGGKTVRELTLADGVYRVIVHRKNEGGWTADAPVTPMRNGIPLTDIPFVLVTTKARAFNPVEGPLDHVCLTNGHLYREQADAKNSRFYSSAPILTVFGAKKTDITINPGTILWFEDHTKDEPIDTKFVEFSGAGQETLENAVRDLKDDMAKLGSNILASEKSAAEAAETHAIRRSSENSVLASMARAVSRKVEEALNWVAWWMTGEEDAVSYSLNTDFVPTPMTAEERKAALAEWQSGAISIDTFYEMLIAGEVLPDSFDAEAEKQKIAAESAFIDRPSGPPMTGEA